MLLPKDTGGNYELPPADVCPALLYRLIDLGTQKIKYNNEDKYQRKVMFQWELHGNHRMKDGQPFSFTQYYTYSSNEKSAMRKDLEAWRGVPFTDADFGKFDLKVLLGKPCMVNIIHVPKKDGTGVYASKSSISRLYQGMQAPALVNEAFCFSLDEFDPAIFAKLSERLQEKIKLSPEYAEAMAKYDTAITGQPAAQATEEFLDDSIPF